MRFVLLAVAAAVAGAQNPQPAEPGLTLRSTAREVVLDLVVRDSRGRQVKDLKPEMVGVYEDGVKQEIRGFRLVTGKEVRERQARTAATPAYPVHALNLVCLVFHNIQGDAERLKYALHAAEQFLSIPLQPDTYVGVFRLDFRIVALHPFTENRAELIQAARGGFMGRPMDVTRAADAVFAAAGGKPVAPAAQPVSEARGIAGTMATAAGSAAAMGNANISARQQMDQMTSMIQQLGPLPGRKTVLLFSPGILNPEEPELLEAVVKKANEAHMTVYAIDVNALNAAGIDTKSLGRVAEVSARQGADTQDAKTIMENMRQMDDLMTTVRSSDLQAAMRTLAEGTGGKLFTTYELKKPFQRIVEDVDTHYEVTYRPGASKLDGRLRSVDVRLARAGLSVQSRKGYFAVPEAGGPGMPAAFEMTALGALAAETRPRDFPYYAGAFRFPSSETGSRYALGFELPGANLTATPAPEQGRHKVHASVLALVKDAGGEVVAKISRDFPMEVSQEQLAGLRSSTINYARAVQLAPGRYTVETAVVDGEGARSSTNVFQIENSPRRGLGLSDVVLVQRVEAVTGQQDASDPLQLTGRRVVPELAPALPANAQLFAYFVVYPDPAKADKPRIQVQVLRNGQAIIEQPSDLPAPNSAGAIPMTIQGVTKPGQYELRITAVQGADSATQSARYSIAGE